MARIVREFPERRRARSSTSRCRCRTAAVWRRASGCRRTPTTIRCRPILEYIPYRKNDLTLRARRGDRAPMSPATATPYVRLDLRGTGDSEGLMRDEYTAQELQDGCRRDRVDRGAALVRRQCRHDRHLLGRLQRPAGRGDAAAGTEGGHHVLLDRRPLCRRRPLHGRHPADRPDLSWASIMFGRNTAAARSAHMSAIAGESMWMPRLKESGLWLKNWLEHQTARRFLEARLDLRGL